MRAHRLSSSATLFLKVVWPGVLIVVGALVMFMLFVARAEIQDPSGVAAHQHERWLILGVFIAMTWLEYLFGIRLKRVRLDEGALYISNFRTEIRVPLADVAGIHEHRWVANRPVTVEFRRNTRFGKRVVFMPRLNEWAGVIAELTAAVGRAQGFR